MAKTYSCDVCRKTTDEIVGKLFFTPLTPGRGANNFSNNYSHHLDVGACCSDRLLKSFNFHERLSAAEYQKQRRRSTPRRRAKT